MAGGARGQGPGAPGAGPPPRRPQAQHEIGTLQSRRGSCAGSLRAHRARHAPVGRGWHRLWRCLWRWRCCCAAAPPLRVALEIAGSRAAAVAEVGAPPGQACARPPPPVRLAPDPGHVVRRSLPCSGEALLALANDCRQDFSWPDFPVTPVKENACGAMADAEVTWQQVPLFLGGRAGEHRASSGLGRQRRPWPGERCLHCSLPPRGCKVEFMAWRAWVQRLPTPEGVCGAGGAGGPGGRGRPAAQLWSAGPPTRAGRPG